MAKLAEIAGVSTPRIRRVLHERNARWVIRRGGTLLTRKVYRSHEEAQRVRLKHDGAEVVRVS